MITAHYAHRLPADYDVSLIRQRAARRGPLWDAVPELCFKAFLLRERGRFGAAASNYSSLYLWQQAGALRDMLTSGRFKVVTDGFGWPGIQTGIVLDALRGTAQRARFVRKEEVSIPIDDDLAEVTGAEIERNRAVAQRPGVASAVVSIDPGNWRLTRIILTDDEPDRDPPGVTYEVLYLARPLLDALPLATSR
ncbi:MAG: DUF4865 family protein [Bradyrhizobium sp.]